MIVGFSDAPNTGGACGSPPATNLQLWYKADSLAGAGYADNDPIGTSPGWPNSASAGSFPTYKLVQAAGAGSPVYHTTGFNGLPKVSFAYGSTQFFSIKDGGAFIDISAWTAGTIYAVLKSANDPALDGSTSSGDWGIWKIGDADAATAHPFTDGVIYEGAGTTARKTAGNPTPSLANLHLYSVTTASGSYRVHLNTTELFSTGTNTVNFGHASGNQSIGFSKIGVVQGYFNGDLAEILMYDAAHNDATRATVEAYLNCRWGL